MVEVDGATLTARNLKKQGVQFMFGIVGFPVQPIAAAAQREGITYVGLRNEQSAPHAAQAVGYLTGLPGIRPVCQGAASRMDAAPGLDRRPPAPARLGVVSPFQFGGAPFTAAAVSGCRPRASRIWCSRDAAKATIRDSHTRATHRRDVCGRPFGDSLGVGGRSAPH